MDRNLLERECEESLKLMLIGLNQAVISAAAKACIDYVEGVQKSLDIFLEAWESRLDSLKRAIAATVAVDVVGNFVARKVQRA